MSNPMTGEQIESAMDLLNSNGGLGEWEATEETSGVQRWVFPRFEGAPTNEDGTLVNAAHGYLSRTGLGAYDTDVEWLAALLDADRAIVGGALLRGNPGTGKSALADAAVTYAKRKAIKVTATADHTKDALLLRFVGEGKGDPLPSGEASPFTLGPVAYACKHGLVLVVDEFYLFVDGVKQIFYPLLDGSPVLPEGNVDGSPLPIHPDTRVIITANPDVRGASLPEPIASRFASTTVTVETSPQMLRDLGVDDSIVAAWEALGVAGLWRPEIREVRLADYWMDVDPVQSVSAFLPEHCPESQRTDIRNLVVGYIGGDTARSDGRLVVS